MRLYSNDDIRRIRQHTMAEQQLSELDFVLRTGDYLSEALMREIKPGRRITVFAGENDCGAYTLEACRLMCAAGYDMEIYLFNIGGHRLTPECEACRTRLIEDENASCDFIEVTGLQFTMPELSEKSVVIDGLCDGNYSGRLTGGYQHIVRIINESGARIISVDVPSGLPSDPTSGLINRNIVNADTTLALGLPRIAFFMAENAEVVGRWKVVDIGYSHQAMRNIQENYYLIESSEVSLLLPRRPLCCSKADFGSAIIFAGSYGMEGAAILATKAAVRSGAGKVTCYSARCGYFLVQSAVPSALFLRDQSDVMITEIVLKHDYNAVGIGPGIGTDDSSINALERFLKVANANSRPLVLDADALNCIALRPTMLNYVPVLSVLTPHAAEFDRLFGTQPSPEARLAKAIEMAEAYKVIIVLKGYYTYVVRPDRKVCINSSGTPALATAGTGDVLTGIITGLIAQGIKPEMAAVAGVYIHGVAGQIAENRHGQYGVAADDVADSVGAAIKKIMK